MSRSGYSDELDNWDLIKWRGQVASATRGKRGQHFLRDLLSALDEMPEKRLIAEKLEDADQVCAIGCLGRERGIDMKQLDPDDAEGVGAAFGIAPCLAQEVVHENDEGAWRAETPEGRWERMRNWVASQILVREAAPQEGEP